MPWSKGQSGNPKGRSYAIIEVEKMARFQCPAAIKALARIVRSEKAPAAAVVSAASVLLERGYGKARQDLHIHRSDEFSDLSDDDLRARILEIARGLSAMEKRLKNPAMIEVNPRQSDASQEDDDPG